MKTASPPVQRPRALTGRAVAALLLGWAAALHATPFVPSEDAMVLERVAARSALEALAPLQRRLQKNPADLPTALALAQGYIDIAREQGDPRYVGYAQASLSPWMRAARPPEAVLVLQAISLQYLHRFDEALTLLNAALRLEPLDAQAWLTRASLLELRGDLEPARRACARLTRAADQLIALTCLLSVEGRNGRLAESFAALSTLAGSGARLPPSVHSWMLSVLAEMAERQGDTSAAQAALEAALARSPRDPYLKAALADSLLRLGRPQEVIALLAADEAQDPLLLRLAIAARRSGDARAQRWAALFAARFEAAQREGNALHLREQGRFLLEVRDDAQRALELAVRNWQTQREPADVCLYAEALQRSGGLNAGTPLARWLADTHYEDRTLPTPSAVAAR